MSDIKDMLERVQQRGVAVVARAPVYNVYGRGAYNMAPIIKPTVWLTPEYFAAWLVEQQVCSRCSVVSGVGFSDQLAHSVDLRPAFPVAVFYFLVS